MKPHIRMSPNNYWRCDMSEGNHSPGFGKTPKMAYDLAVIIKNIDDRWNQIFGTTEPRTKLAPFDPGNK